MSTRTRFVSFAVLGMCVAAASPAGAHRVDEYLQATRISVEIDRVDLEIDLTPGMTVASEVSRWIDTNRDGQVSGAEAATYAREILRSVALAVDGRRVPITLVEIHVPELGEMSLGTGTIRVRATARMSRQGQRAGPHQLVYSNTHRADSSVYLVNALVPADSRIQIAGQHRDSAQHGLTFEYTVARDVRWAPFLLIGLAMTGVWGIWRLPRPSAPS
jgi:hypothetical protein